MRSYYVNGAKRCDRDDNTFILSGEDHQLSVSDGYHTMDELYEHRIELFIALSRCFIKDGRREAWRSKVHSDGSAYEGWFILGIGREKGKQITYHIPLDYWSRCAFAETLEKAPEWDGHSPADVLERLAKL